MKVRVDDYKDGVYYARIETNKADFKKLLDDFILHEDNGEILKLKRKIDKVCKDRDIDNY